MSRVVPCPDCKGGMRKGRWCQRCQGEGFVEGCTGCGHAPHPPSRCTTPYGVPGFPSTQSPCQCIHGEPTIDQGEAA